MQGVGEAVEQLTGGNAKPYNHLQSDRAVSCKANTHLDQITQQFHI